MKTLNKALLIVLAAGSLVAVFAGPAAARSEDGTCEVSSVTLNPNAEFCLYYNPSRAGAVYDRSFASGNDGNLIDNYFLGSLNGHGKVVRNDAASAQDGVMGESVYVYQFVNFTGTAVFVPSYSWVELGALRNNEASYRWTE